MHQTAKRTAAAVFSTLMLSATPSRTQELPPGYGPHPQLPLAQENLIPTLNTSKSEPWPPGAGPTAAAGLKVVAFAKDLRHPRWMHVLPNGDVLVAEAASQPSASWAPRAVVQNWAQRRSGGIVESANRISLLRDADGDGIAEVHTVLLEGLRQPFGMALIGKHLYIANTDSVMRYDFQLGATSITTEGTKLFNLPVGHHWTRALLASPNGQKLFVTVGSGSNIGEKGLEIEKGRATILEFDVATGNVRTFASGLRNANGMAFEPTSGSLWTVVNERDELGDDTPPDYLTSVKDGGFYGWPYSYWGKTVDTRVKPQRPDLVASAITPDYALGGHTASLGLAWFDGDQHPSQFRGGMVIGQHGSWNRSVHSGYKVVFIPFKDGKPNGAPVDMLTGFLSADGSGKAHGRPVGVSVDKKGGLLIADDTGNTIWRLTAQR